MRVALLSITGGGMSGGYVKYLREAVPLLLDQPEITALNVLSPLSGLRELGVSGRDNLRETAIDAFYRPLTRTASREVATALHEFDPDVVFVPNLRVILGIGAPLVVMARNMEPLTWNDSNDPWRQRAINAARRLEGRAAVLQAAKIIAVSHFVENFLIGCWHVPPTKVSVVYHGVSTHEAPLRPARLADVRPGFLFTAGATRPSRGLEDIISALPALTEKADLRVIIAGSADPAFRNYENALHKASAGYVSNGSLTWAGALTPAQMAWCYQNAGVFLMTSRVEACPNIALEAMANGALIVAASNPPLPEIFGDSADYYDPGDSQSLASSVRRALETDSQKRIAHAAAAKRRAEGFTWSRTAALTAAALEASIRRPPAPRMLD